MGTTGYYVVLRGTASTGYYIICTWYLVREATLGTTLSCGFARDRVHVQRTLQAVAGRNPRPRAARYFLLGRSATPWAGQVQHVGGQYRAPARAAATEGLAL